MSWWNDFTSAVNDIIGSGNPGDVATNISNWLTSPGGGIASGIEGGIVAFLKDLWDLILGPVEVITGAVIILIAVGIALRNDVIGILPRPRVLCLRVFLPRSRLPRSRLPKLCRARVRCGSPRPRMPISARSTRCPHRHDTRR